MTYAKDDLRSALTTSAAARPSGAVAAPEFLDFSVTAPDVVTPAGSRQWIVRGQNFVLIHTEPVPGDVIFSGELRSEQVVLVIDESSGISAGEHAVTGPALVVVPPGAAELVSTGSGQLTQLIQSDELEWAAKASNADSYAHPHPHVAPLELWPEPVGGYRWRTYRMADVPDDPKRFGRIFRTRAFMVNFLKANQGPRNPHKLSPHFHDDFEQCSLIVAGTYVHHIQTPWGTDADDWRPEDHARVGSPSATVIPPPTVHTSQAIGSGANHLIDIFSGPRHDFSAQPGWVLNAGDYPAPPA
ncbi:hypothetical protein Amsp01_093720 [Amycolatopsis sp. NBRC 101858]|uniref:hypothetical protein n=1 Tax=Amycolatopsis sp. NBRC 101858 TaxID=3032200 RepID=UPI00249FC67C|nr:hypothetical protein [Amycolatopsis sp. NBRC 101858]GLY43349.1 hypothetical protein Amsp01_093720 [Amycolatopsis sp. NBRC 101858]